MLIVFLMLLLLQCSAQSSDDDEDEWIDAMIRYYDIVFREWQQQWPVPGKYVSSTNREKHSVLFATRPMLSQDGDVNLRLLRDHQGVIVRHSKTRLPFAKDHWPWLFEQWPRQDNVMPMSLILYSNTVCFGAREHLVRLESNMRDIRRTVPLTHVNRFYLFGDIVSHKAHFALLLNEQEDRYGVRHPQTWIANQIVDQDGARLANDLKRIWVLKDPTASGGTGVHFYSAEALLASNMLMLRERLNHVVQEYIDSPLLIEGRKFTIRFWALVASIDPLRIYWWPCNGPVRLASNLWRSPHASDDYVELIDEPTMADFDRYAHITNMQTNADNEDFQQAQEKQLRDNSYEKHLVRGNEWLFNTHLVERFGQQVADDFHAACGDQIVRALAVSVPHLQREWSAVATARAQARQTRFQLIGADLDVQQLLDPNSGRVTLAPVLMEVNQNPVQHCAQTQHLGETPKLGCHFMEKMRADMFAMVGVVGHDWRAHINSLFADDAALLDAIDRDAAEHADDWSADARARRRFQLGRLAYERAVLAALGQSEPLPLADFPLGTYLEQLFPSEQRTYSWLSALTSKPLTPMERVAERYYAQP
jgi:Tubulin-tyrosine ligase family